MKLPSIFSVVVMAIVSSIVGCAMNQMDQTNQTNQKKNLSALRAASNPLLTSVCAKDDPIVIKLVRNLHVPNLMDRIETKSCSVGSVKTYISTAASNPNGLPMLLEITRPHRLLPKYMNVGEPVSQLTTYLGKPTSDTDGNVVYSLSKNGDLVTFVVRNERISSVRWEWTLD